MTYLHIFIFAILCSSICQCDCTLFDKDWDLVKDIKFKLSARNLKFPCEASEALYREHGKYLPGNSLVTRVQVYMYTAIVTIPRYRPGIPITLGKVTLNHRDNNPVIAPFPDWSYQQEGKCGAIQSAVDIYLDRSNILWVLDDGTVNSFAEPIKACPPKVLAISMHSNKIIYTIDLSPYVLPSSNLQFIVAETTESGEDYVYVSDGQNGAIIAVRASNGFGNRLNFPPSVQNECPGTCTMFMAMTMKADFKNYLYLTYINCRRMFYIDTESIRNDENNIYTLGKQTDIMPVSILGTDKLSKIFFRLNRQTTLYMWDSNLAWHPDHWVQVQNTTTGRVTTHVTPGPWKMMWALESNAHDYIYDSCGCYGPSVVLHPITNNVDRSISSSLNKILKTYSRN